MDFALWSIRFILGSAKWMTCGQGTRCFSARKRTTEKKKPVKQYDGVEIGLQVQVLYVVGGEVVRHRW